METVLESVQREKPAKAIIDYDQELRHISMIDRYDRFIDSIKFSHYGIMSMSILIGSCLGSITAMFLFYYHAPIWVFAIGLFATLANLVTCIGQAPTKWVVNMLILATVINVTLLAISPVI
jgi:hypothetical protein